jgi:hypothetical protein
VVWPSSRAHWVFTHLHPLDRIPIDLVLSRRISATCQQAYHIRLRALLCTSQRDLMWFPAMLCHLCINSIKAKTKGLQKNPTHSLHFTRAFSNHISIHLFVEVIVSQPSLPKSSKKSIYQRWVVCVVVGFNIYTELWFFSFSRMLPYVTSVLHPIMHLFHTCMWHYSCGLQATLVVVPYWAACKGHNDLHLYRVCILYPFAYNMDKEAHRTAHVQPASVRHHVMMASSAQAVYT